METLDKGKLAAKPIAWPVGLVVTCPVCHWRGRIEAKDLERGSTGRIRPAVCLTTARTPRGSQYAEIACPTPGCDTTIREDNPGGNWTPVYGGSRFPADLPATLPPEAIPAEAEPVKDTAARIEREWQRIFSGRLWEGSQW